MFGGLLMSADDVQPLHDNTMIVPEDTPVPMPADWAKLHQLMIQARNQRSDIALADPPVPLILAGAAFSSATEIRRRWKDLVRWANEFGFGELLARNLPEPPHRDVAEDIAGVAPDGRTWWHESSYHEPSIRPSITAITTARGRLKQQWATIVGVELARTTKPMRFTGRKFRRLLVVADPNASPPWGSWHMIVKERASFATVRKAVNVAISPLVVDHIEFVTARWGD